MPKIKQPPVLNKTQVLLAKDCGFAGRSHPHLLERPSRRRLSERRAGDVRDSGKDRAAGTDLSFIASDGGNGQASLRLVNLLRQYRSRLIALVPLECASAATMIALGADEILMGPMAFLTSVDDVFDPRAVSRSIATTSGSPSASTKLTRVISLWRAEQTDTRENPYKTLYSACAFTGDSCHRSRGIPVDHAMS